MGFPQDHGSFGRALRDKGMHASIQWMVRSTARGCMLVFLMACTHPQRFLQPSSVEFLVAFRFQRHPWGRRRLPQQRPFPAITQIIQRLLHFLDGFGKVYSMPYQHDSNILPMPSQTVEHIYVPASVTQRLRLVEMSPQSFERVVNQFAVSPEERVTVDVTRCVSRASADIGWVERGLRPIQSRTLPGG